MQSRNQDGDTPLHYSSAFKHDALSRALIAAGAAVNATNARGETPLHTAVDSGARTAVHLLISSRALVNAATHATGDTPLHYACVWGFVPVVNLLLECGADPGIANAGYSTPRDEAVSKGYQTCVDLIDGFPGPCL